MATLKPPAQEIRPKHGPEIGLKEQERKARPAQIVRAKYE